MSELDVQLLAEALLHVAVGRHFDDEELDGNLEWSMTPRDLAKQVLEEYERLAEGAR
jgi:hypothetical protein